MPNVTAPRGKAGTLVASGAFEDDHIRETRGVEGQKLYNKMLISDSQISKLFFSLTNPIKSAKWLVQPASDDPIDETIADLVSHILFNDIDFQHKLDEILLFPWLGFSIFEVIFENKTHPLIGNYTGLNAFAFRDQRSITKWNYSRNGELLSVTQVQGGDIDVHVDIPADQLIIFYQGKKGADIGLPLLRPLYGNYKRKLIYKKLQAIGIERGAVPVPHVTIPPSVDHESEEYKAVEALLKGFSRAEKGYIITPEGYSINFFSNDFDASKVQVAIKSENEEISGSILASFLEMGIGGNAAVGASTGQTLLFFRNVLESFANKIADKINKELIPSVVAYNFAGVRELPKLTHSGISDQVGEELMRVITGYSQQGLVTPDEDLEAFLRETHNLPKKMEGTETQARPQEDETQEEEEEGEQEETVDQSVNLATMAQRRRTKRFIEAEGQKIATEISNMILLSSEKYIDAVMRKMRTLPKNRKQNATNDVTLTGQNQLRRSLRDMLALTASTALTQVRQEVPSKRRVKLSIDEKTLRLLSDKINRDNLDMEDFQDEDLPVDVKVVLAKQAQLIAEDVTGDLEKRLDFTFSNIQTKTDSEEVMRTSMRAASSRLAGSNVVATRGNNVSALIINVSRDRFLRSPEVAPAIHSYTFFNEDPKTDICMELAGTTFATEDEGSWRFSPPLHHNCKSYVVPNLQTQRGVDRLEVTRLAPSAEAQAKATLL